MEGMCARCARLTLVGRNATRTHVGGIRRLSTTPALRQDDDRKSWEISGTGRPMSNTMKTGPARESTPRSPPKLVIHKQMVGPKPDAQPQARPVVRRANNTPAGTFLRRTGAGHQGSAQVVRRSGAPQGGQLLRRTGSGRAAAGPGAARGGQPGRPKVDKRRRRAKPTDGEDEDFGASEDEMNQFIKQYIHPPYNPEDSIVYNPQNLSLNDFRADWPNTAMTKAGMTESVIQKIEWLAKRLPHGYQSPEQIAEHYLKGNLTRFDSEEEKQLVLKLAAEKSAETKREDEEGTLNKHRLPRFAIVEDPSFTSVGAKQEDKNHLLQATVQGDYGEEAKQRYSFLQNAARTLNNNETYKPESVQRVLDRVQALIPKGRPGGAQQAKKA